MPTRFNLAMGLAAIVALASGVARAADAPPACVPAYRADVTLDPGEGILTGTLVADVTCPGGTPEDLVFWLYPNAFSEPPDLMNAMNAYWIYPMHFAPASMSLASVSVDGTVRSADPLDLPEGHPLAGLEGVAVTVPNPAAGDPEVRVEIRYEVRVPKRYGTFGRARRGILLASGWHPLLAARGDGAWDLDAPTPPAAREVTLALPAGYDALLGGLAIEGEGTPGGGSLRTHEWTGGPGETVAIAAYRRLERMEVACHGVLVRWHGIDRRTPKADFDPSGGDAILGIPESLPDVMAWDRPLQALETVCRTVALYREAGGDVAPGSRIDVLEAPLRLEPAASAGDLVIASDRMFDILPVARAWKYHEFQLARATARSLVTRARPATPARTADLVASHVVDLYTEEHHGEEEYVRDFLRWGAFLSAIDYFLYSPLVEFRESYFRTVAEEDWLREEPWAFNTSLPRGKLHHDKLVDLLGPEAVARIVEGVLAHGRDPRELSEQEWGGDMDWFWDQWSVAYPSLNYRVATTTSERTGDGLWRHAARVERQGDTWVEEPVTVRFQLEGGSHEDVTWLDSGPSGEVAVESTHDLVRVVVDPEMRLFEDASLTEGHPYHDNYSKPVWRPPVFSSFALTTNLTELSGDIDVVFVMRPKFDMNNSMSFRLVWATWGQGGTFWYMRGFGPRRDMDNSSWYVGGWLTGFHHNARWGYAGPDHHHKGTSFTAGISIQHDDRYYLFNPTDGWEWSLSASYSLGVDDDKWSGGPLRHSGSVGTRLFGLWTPRGGHTFALYGGAGGTFGDPYLGQLENLSSYTTLRGFDADETFGLVRLYLVGEWRHTFTHSMHVNILHYATWVGIQGVLFAGTGTVSETDSYHGLFTADRVFTEVGYGLRGILRYFGAYPGIIALDLAVPITPLDRPGRLPVAIRLAFNHTY